MKLLWTSVDLSLINMGAKIFNALLTRTANYSEI